MDAMMILGPFIFGLSTAAPQEVTRDTSYRWPAQDVFGSQQALQFTGWGEDKITLTGVIYPEFSGGTGQLDAMRGTADTGVPLTLIDGRGNIIGDYVIENINERQSIFAGAGVALKQEFTMQLKRYGDGDGAAGAIAAAVGAALGAVASGASDSAGLSSVASSAVASAGVAASNLGGVQTILQGISGAQAALAAVGQGLASARTLQSAARDAQAAIAAAGEISSLTTAQSTIGGLQSAAVRTLQTATMASGTISKAMGAMADAGSPPADLSEVNGAMIEANRLAATATGIRTQVDTVLRGFTS